MIIRNVKKEDAARLLEIYSYYVENTAITFEIDVPTLEEFTDRIFHIWCSKKTGVSWVIHMREHSTKEPHIQDLQRLPYIWIKTPMERNTGGLFMRNWKGA